MIYRHNDTGVFLIENDMRESSDVTIGYKVGNERKVVTFQHRELPQELMNEFAVVTNKIARFANEEVK